MQCITIIISFSLFLPTCYFIDTAKEQCLLKHSLSFSRGGERMVEGGREGKREKKWHACRMFRVTTAAAEIERFQIKAIQYLAKKYQIGVPLAK